MEKLYSYTVDFDFEVDIDDIINENELTINSTKDKIMNAIWDLLEGENDSIYHTVPSYIREQMYFDIMDRLKEKSE